MPLVHSTTSGPCMSVVVSMTFFLGELNPGTLSFRRRYSSILDMKSLAWS